MRRSQFLTLLTLWFAATAAAGGVLPEGLHVSQSNDEQTIVGIADGEEVLRLKVEIQEQDSSNSRVTISQPSAGTLQLTADAAMVVTGTVTGGDLMPCTPKTVESRVPVVRAVSGFSTNRLNTGVYCRDGDWALVVREANDVRVIPAPGSAAGLECALEAKGKTLQLELIPRFYQQRRGLSYFEPREYTLPARVPSGWISWKAYKGAVSEGDIKRTADWAADNLRDYGLDYLIIDDGWFVGSNRGMLHSVPGGVDWTRANDGFPSGMAPLTRYVHDRGLKIGLWLTPFGCSSADLQQEHPDWWVHQETEGEILQSSWHGKAFVDGSNPEAVAEWLVKGIRAQAAAGFDYFKIDGQKHVAYDAYEQSGDYFPAKGSTWQGALREGWNAIRRASGDRYVLACWGRVPEIAGYPLAIRIGSDKDSSWKSIVGVATDLANWYYEHNVVWCVDPDHLVFSNINLAECRTWATLVGLTGTHLTFSDKIEEYTPEKLEVLRRILPTIHGPSARPAAMYSLAKPPALWTLEVDRPFDRWLVVANSSVGDPVAEIYFSDLGLDPTNEYAVYDFWKGEFRGVYKSAFPCGLPTGKATQVFSIREVRKHPWLVSTNRHISQGGVDLLELSWDEERLTLSGRSHVVARDPYRIAVHVPRGFTVAEGRLDENPMAIRTSQEFAELATTPEQSGAFDWQIRFQRTKVPAP